MLKGVPALVTSLPTNVPVVGLKALIYFEIMTTVALVLRTKRVARHAAVNGIARLGRTV